MDKSYPPNHAQLQSAVKGTDPCYRIRVKRRPFWAIQAAYAFVVMIILIASFAALLVIGTFVESLLSGS